MFMYSIRLRIVSGSTYSTGSRYLFYFSTHILRKHPLEDDLNIENFYKVPNYSIFNFYSVKETNMQKGRLKVI